MNPRHTNSTGNTLHFFMMVTLGSGMLMTALFTMCRVFSNHHALVWFSTCGARRQQAQVPCALRPRRGTTAAVCSVKRGGGGGAQRPFSGSAAHLALERDGGQVAVERGLAVRGDDDHLVAQVVRVAHLALRACGRASRGVCACCPAPRVRSGCVCAGTKAEAAAGGWRAALRRCARSCAAAHPVQHSAQRGCGPGGWLGLLRAGRGGVPAFLRLPTLRAVSFSVCGTACSMAATTSGRTPWMDWSPALCVRAWGTGCRRAGVNCLPRCLCRAGRCEAAAVVCRALACCSNTACVHTQDGVHNLRRRCGSTHGPPLPRHPLLAALMLLQGAAAAARGAGVLALHGGWRAVCACVLAGGAVCVRARACTGLLVQGSNWPGQTVSLPFTSKTLTQASHAGPQLPA